MTLSDYDLDRAAALAWQPPDYEPCAVAAKKGDLALLQGLLATGNPWNRCVLLSNYSYISCESFSPFDLLPLIHVT